jgi:hypothetical protein
MERKEVREWISVEERLPNCEKVLAIYVSKPGAIYNMRHDGWFIDTIYTCRMHESKFIIESHGPDFPASHWMPLPKPPKDLAGAPH